MSDPKDDAYDLRSIFERIERDLIASMKRNLRRHEAEEEKEGFKWEQWQLSKLKNLAAYRRENKKIVGNYSKEVEQLVNESLNDSYKRGEGFFTRLLNKIKTFFSRKKIEITVPRDVSHYKGKGTPAELDFFGMNEKKLDALQRSVNENLANAQGAVLRRTNDIYRQTIYKAEMHMAAGAKTIDQAIDMATEEFLQKGIDCIEYTDKAGNLYRRVNIAAYAEMALRTASHRAMLLGEGKKRDEWGIHTVVVSAHANTCKKCAPWQGKILVDDVFSSGTAEEAKELGYPLLSEAIKQGLLHPNCRHTISTYFPGITKLPEIPDEKEAIQRYNAEQKQRKLEREIVKWKRIEEGSIQPEKIAEAHDNVAEYQKRLRDHIKEHPYLRRMYSREKVRG